MKPFERPTSHFSVQSYLSKTSQHSYNSIDGLNIIHRKLNVFDYLKDNRSEPHIKKNILFDHPFPLIEVISKRKILNNSNRLLKDLIKCNQKSLLKMDEKYITKRYEDKAQSASNSLIAVKHEAQPVMHKKDEVAMSLTQLRLHKQEEFESKTSTDTLYSLTSLPKVEKRTIAVSNLHRKSHDSNLVNKSKLFRDPSVNFTLNAYKMKRMYMNEHFVNKIKQDVSHLKFNKELRVCVDLIQ